MKYAERIAVGVIAVTPMFVLAAFGLGYWFDDWQFYAVGACASWASAWGNGVEPIHPAKEQQ